MLVRPTLHLDEKKGDVELTNGKKKPPWLLILFFAFFTALLLYSIYQLILYYVEADESDTLNEEIIDQAVVMLPETEADIYDDAPTSDSVGYSPDTGDTLPDPDRFPDKNDNGSEPKEQVPLTVDFDALSEINSDIIAWIYVKDTKINYPIVQGKNNDYYLRRMTNKKWNVGGSIFADFRIDPSLGDLNSIIYGHNMQNGTMFGSLVKYKKQTYYDEHPTAWILTPEMAYRVDFIAGFVTKTDADTYKLFDDPAALEAYLETLKGKSTFESDVDITDVERIVTLSTCSYEYKNARYVLVGSLIPIEY